MLPSWFLFELRALANVFELCCDCILVHIVVVFANGEQRRNVDNCVTGCGVFYLEAGIVSCFMILHLRFKHEPCLPAAG